MINKTILLENII